jgi:protein TonB
MDAIEIAVGEFHLQAGATPSLARSVREAPVVSPVDLATIEKKESSVPEVLSVSALSQVEKGEGGEAESSQGEGGTPWDRYRMQVRQRIHQALLYPSLSKNLGETGQVKLKLKVLRDGTISGVEIAEPSAFDRLNTAAVETIRRVARLDPFPESHDANQWEAVVPIDFALR